MVGIITVCCIKFINYALLCFVSNTKVVFYRAKKKLINSLTKLCFNCYNIHAENKTIRCYFLPKSYM